MKEATSEAHMSHVVKSALKDPEQREVVIKNAFGAVTKQQTLKAVNIGGKYFVFTSKPVRTKKVASKSRSFKLVR